MDDNKRKATQSIFGSIQSFTQQPEPRAVTIKKMADDLVYEDFNKETGTSGMISEVMVRHVYKALCDATNLDDNDEDKKDIIEVLIRDYPHIKTDPVWGTEGRTILMYAIHQTLYPAQSLKRKLHEPCEPALILNTLIDFYNRNSVGEEKEKFSMNEKVYTDGDTDLIRLVKPDNWVRPNHWESDYYPNEMPELINIISEITDLDLKQENDNDKPAFLVLVENIKSWYQKCKPNNQASLNKYMGKMAYCIRNMLNTATQLIRNDKTVSYTLRTQQHLQSAIKSMITLIPIIDEIHNYLHEVVEELEQGWDDLFFEIILNIPRDLELSKYSKKLNIVMKNRIFKACIKKYLISCLEDRYYFEDNQDLTTAAINSMGNIPSDKEYFESLRDNALNNLQAEYDNRIQDSLESITNEGLKETQQIVDEEEVERAELENRLQMNNGMPTEQANHEFLNQANEQGVGAQVIPGGIVEYITRFSSPSGNDVQASHAENIQDPFCNFVLRTANNDNIHDIVEGIHNSIELYIGNRISINTDTITNNKTILGMLYEIIDNGRGTFFIKNVIYNCLYRPFEIGQFFLNENIQKELKKIKRKETDIPSKEEFIEFHSENIKTLQGYSYQGRSTKNIFLITEMNRTLVGNEFLPIVFYHNEHTLFRENDPHTVGILCIRMYEKVLREHLYNSLFERMSTYKGFNEIISVEGEQINIVDDPVFVEDSIYDEYLRNNNNEDSLYDQILRNSGGKKRTHKNKSLKKNKKGQKNKRTKKNIGKKKTKKVKKNAKKKSKKRSVR